MRWEVVDDEQSSYRNPLLPKRSVFLIMWILQILVMLGDVLLVGVCAYLLWLMPLSLLTWVVIVLGFRAWWLAGNWEAWNPKIIRRYLHTMMD